MRVLLYWPFAREEQMGLATALAAAGQRVIVQTLDREGAPTPNEVLPYDLASNLPEVDLTASPWWARVTSRAATYVRRSHLRRRAVQQSRPDLLHVYFLNYWTDVIALRRLRRRIPVVVSVHDVRPHVRRLPRRLEDACLRALYGSGDHIVVHHEYLRARLQSEFGVSPEVISVVPHPVEPVATGGKGLPEELVVLFFGALRQNKGLAVLLEALTQVDLPGIKLLIAGRGEPALERMVLKAAEEDPRIEERIGWVSAEEKARYYAQARVVVLPYTEFSSQSGVLHDAYSHRRPVVVTDVGALGRTVKADGTGWVVPPGDATALAHAVTTALTEGVDDTRARSLDRVLTERHPDQVAVALCDAYAIACSRKRQHVLDGRL